MKRKYSLGFAGLAVMVLLGLAIPRSVHAVAAALVQVVNTTANPVPNLDTEKHGRIPYQSSVAQTCSGPSCAFFPTVVPAGYRLVAQHVGGSFYLQNSSPAPYIFFTDTFNMGMSWTGALGPSAGSYSVAGTDQPILAYFDAGYAPELVVYGSFASGLQRVTVTGYLENCSITGCPTIQN